MIEVNDGPRILRFEGRELAFSTSERRGVGRWIEFTLYKTSGDGKYVLSRIGVSNVYHTPECLIAKRSGLDLVPWTELSAESMPCHRVPDVQDPCYPDPEDFPMVRAEQDKTWARVYTDPQRVLSGLVKHNRDGEAYLTAVSRRLLEDAAREDDGIAGIYQVEIVT